MKKRSAGDRRLRALAGGDVWAADEEGDADAAFVEGAFAGAEGVVIRAGVLGSLLRRSRPM